MPASITLSEILVHSSGVKFCLFAIAASYTSTANRVSRPLVLFLCPQRELGIPITVNDIGKDAVGRALRRGKFAD
jgi:hypothetical protein